MNVRNKRVIDTMHICDSKSIPTTASLVHFKYTIVSITAIIGGSFDIIRAEDCSTAKNDKRA